MALAVTKRTDPPTPSSSDTRTLMLMASALGLRDKYTHAHAYRVASYSKRLAVRAGLPMHEVLQVAMGGIWIYVFAGQFEMHTPKIGAHLLMHAERALQFAQNIFKPPRLMPALSCFGITMHGIAHPQHLRALFLHGLD